MVIFGKKIMLSLNLINKNIYPIKTSITGKKALSLMEEQKISHLPVVNNKDFLGLISEADIMSNNINQSVGSYGLSLINPCVSLDNHIFDVVKIASEFKITIVPVLNNKKIYIGCITLQTLTEEFGKVIAIYSPGAIIELEMYPQDYSPAQIAHIAESNNCKIFHLSLVNLENTAKIIVIIKIDRTDTTQIIQAFSRYNYEVRASYNIEGDISAHLKSRYDSLMSFLNV